MPTVHEVALPRREERSAAIDPEFRVRIPPVRAAGT